MKRKWRRTLSVLLSIAMLFSMTGMNTVFATEGGQTVGARPACANTTRRIPLTAATPMGRRERPAATSTWTTATRK